MSSTVAQVIAKFQRRYPSCEQARALEIFNDVHAEFLTRSQLRNVPLAIPLVAGQGEYDLSPDVMMIHEAYLERSADPSDWLSLVERSTDEYAVMRPGWRVSAGLGSEPTEYYVTSSADGASAKPRIGFWMAPGAGSSPDYPRVRLYTTSKTALGLSDFVPSQIVNDNVYVYGMCAMWLIEQQASDAGEVGNYIQLAERELEKNVQHVKGLQTNSMTAVVPSFALQTRGVV